MTNGVDYGLEKYYILGLMVGSDPKLLTGAGTKSNKILRIDINNDKLIIRAADKENTGEAGE